MKICERYHTRDRLGIGMVVYISDNVKLHPVSVELAYHFEGKSKPAGYLVMAYTEEGRYYKEHG